VLRGKGVGSPSGEGRFGLVAPPPKCGSFRQEQPGPSVCFRSESGPREMGMPVPRGHHSEVPEERCRCQSSALPLDAQQLARGVQLGPDPTHSQRFVQRPNLLQFNGLRADRRVGIRCAVGVRGETPRGTESDEAPAWQGATRKHIGPYSTEEQRRPRGMQSPLECSGAVAAGSWSVARCGELAARTEDRHAHGTSL